jgi:hypothetical protein
MILLSSSDSGEPSYSLSFDLIKAETYKQNEWEGWFSYKLELRKDNKVVSQSTGSIIAEDVLDLASCFIIEDEKKKEIEPIEPDFILSTLRFKDIVTVSCFVDEGHTAEGVYTESGMGLRFVVDNFMAQNFAKEIKSTYDQLSKSLIKID